MSPGTSWERGPLRRRADGPSAIVAVPSSTCRVKAGRRELSPELVLRVVGSQRGRAARSPAERCAPLARMGYLADARAEDPSLNTSRRRGPRTIRIENLAVLCFECHGQTQLSGGFGRKLNGGLVTLYRDHWMNLVSMRRSATLLHNEIDRTNRTAPPSSDPGQIDNAQAPMRATPSRRPTPTPAIPTDAFGATYEHVGIKITLIDATSSRAISMKANGSIYDDEHEVIPAGTGAKFVSICTRVLNCAQVSIDLTCSYPIGNHVIDDRGRQF
jgi:hypothetical protein